MKVQYQNIILSVLLTIGALAPWPPRKAKAVKTIPNKSKKFAFVSDPTGEAIFEEAGLKLIGRFEQHTYLGVLTGESSGEYVEVVSLSESDNETYFFWVRSARIYIIDGVDNFKTHMAGDGKLKTREDFNKIVSALD